MLKKNKTIIYAKNKVDDLFLLDDFIIVLYCKLNHICYQLLCFIALETYLYYELNNIVHQLENFKKYRNDTMYIIC